MKTCTKCGIHKDLEGFYKSASGKYGLEAACKVCKLAAKAARQQTPKAKAAAKAYNDNPERKAAAKIRRSTPEYKAALKIRRSTPEYKAAEKIRQSTPEAKAALKIRQSTPEAKAARNARMKTPANRARRCAFAMKRKAAKLQRTPSWVKLGLIKEVYITCPEGHHVDHIIPLRGELVSGLHIAANLQHLTPFENRSKTNKFDVTQNWAYSATTQQLEVVSSV